MLSGLTAATVIMLQGKYLQDSEDFSFLVTTVHIPSLAKPLWLAVGNLEGAPAQVHDRDGVAHVLDDREVVADEDVG